MATPDVRVRLSAEGVAEVVAALKQIQTEGQKAAQKQSTGFLGLNRILGSTRNLLGGLGIALGVNQIRQFLANVVRMGDELGDSATAVGTNTENLSALNLILRTAGSSAQEGANALAKVNKTLGEARAGAPNAVAVLKDLGLTLDDFKGKDSVEAFELIAKRITALRTPAERGKIAMDIFGRSGANLIPTMEELANEGLGSVIERARELGVLIDEDLANTLDRVADDMELLQMQAEGIGARFMAGFGPELSQSLQTISGDLKQTTEAWEEFGAGIGKVMTFIIGVVSSGFDAVGTYVGLMLASLTSATKGIGLILRGQGDQAKREMEALLLFADKEIAALQERMKARFNIVFGKETGATGSGGGAGGGGGGTEDADAAVLAELAAKRALAMQTALDRELASLKAAATLRTKTEKLAWDEGLKDVTSYFADRRAVIDKAYSDEVAILAEKQALLGDITDPGQRLQYEKQIETELARLKLTHETDIAELLAEERKTVQELGQDRIKLEQTLLEMQGERTEAERLGFEERIRQAELLLRQQGVSDAEREATLARLRSGLEAGAAFEDAKDEADAALASYNAARQEIQARAEAGLISELQAETQILGIEQSRLAVLRDLATALVAAAEATSDPEKIAQAQQFAASISEIGYAVEASASAWTQFQTTLVDSAGSALATFFEDGASGAKSFSEAVSDMTTSILSDISRLASQIMASGIVSWITGMFGSGGQVGSSAVSGGLSDQSMELGAGGGLMQGPGTGTSDSIVARLSNREYVVRAAVVNQPGVLSHLENLNRVGRGALFPVPIVQHASPTRFAAGGLVEGAATAGGGAARNGSLLVGLEDGLVLRHMESPAGERLILKALARNRRAAKALLR